MLIYQVIDYDDESGVYLGPGRAFDDEDLEYLNKNDTEDAQTHADPSPPTPPPLVVDFVSGIYLGFDDTLTDEDDDERGNVSQRTSDNQNKFESVTKPVSMRRLALFRSKQSSKYKVIGEANSEGNICFRFIRKVWRKSDMRQ